MKICPVCKVKKSTNEFYKDCKTSDKLSWACKECTRNNSAKNRLKNPDASKESINRWRVAHILRTKAHGSINGHLRAGYKVYITVDELEQMLLSASICPMCGSVFDDTHEHRKTVDRINNEKILTTDNTWIICHKCNASKQDRTMKELCSWCKLILKKFEGEI